MRVGKAAFLFGDGLQISFTRFIHTAQPCQHDAKVVVRTSVMARALLNGTGVGFGSLLVLSGARPRVAEVVVSNRIAPVVFATDGLVLRRRLIITASLREGRRVSEPCDAQLCGLPCRRLTRAPQLSEGRALSLLSLRARRRARPVRCLCPSSRNIEAKQQNDQDSRRQGFSFCQKHEYPLRGRRREEVELCLQSASASISSVPRIAGTRRATLCHKSSICAMTGRWPKMLWCSRYSRLTRRKPVWSKIRLISPDRLNLNWVG